jgi:exodeoxyribonuclease VIII
MIAEAKPAVAGIEVGIHSLSRAEYELIPAMNHSTLKHFDRTLAEARYYMTHPAAPTAAMELGTALHAALLEPSRFLEDYVVPIKVDRRTTAGKEAWAAFEAANKGKEYLDHDDWMSCIAMRDSLASDLHAHVMAMFKGDGRAARNEVSVVWEDHDTGLPCKALIDRVVSWQPNTLVIDLKKTTDLSVSAFSKAVHKFSYHTQAAWYLDGLAALDMHQGREPVPRDFRFIAFSDQPPYLIRVFSLTERCLLQARDQNRERLRKYASAMATDSWPGYMDGVTEIDLPRYAQDIDVIEV